MYTRNTVEEFRDFLKWMQKIKYIAFQQEFKVTDSDSWIQSPIKSWFQSLALFFIKE